MTNLVLLPDPEAMVLSTAEVAKIVEDKSSWQNLLVIGYDEEGQFQAKASQLSTGEALVLLEAAKIWLLRDLRESMEP